MVVTFPVSIAKIIWIGRRQALLDPRIAQWKEGGKTPRRPGFVPIDSSAIVKTEQDMFTGCFQFLFGLKLERGVDWQLPGVWNYMQDSQNKIVSFFKMVMKRVPTGEKN